MGEGPFLREYALFAFSIICLWVDQFFQNYFGDTFASSSSFIVLAMKSIAHQAMPAKSNREMSGISLSLNVFTSLVLSFWSI